MSIEPFLFQRQQNQYILRSTKSVYNKVNKISIY